MSRTRRSGYGQRMVRSVPRSPVAVPRLAATWQQVSLVATMPLRLARAATQATLAVGVLAAPDGPIRRPGGYAELVLRVIGEDGYAEQLVGLLSDREGPARLAHTLNELIAPERPLGRFLAPGGALDHLLSDDGAVLALLADDGPLNRLLAEDGALEHLLAPDGPLERISQRDGILERLLERDGAIDRLTASGGVLERLLASDGLLEQVLLRDGFLDKLVAEGGTLDQLVALGETLEQIQPRLVELARSIPSLESAADGLGRAVGPLGDLAGRLPLRGRRANGSTAG